MRGGKELQGFGHEHTSVSPNFASEASGSGKLVPVLYSLLRRHIAGRLRNHSAASRLCGDRTQLFKIEVPLEFAQCFVVYLA